MLCIIQDTTNARTVNERLTLNLPASTPLSKLHEDVAHKAGYVTGTFELTWGNAPNTVGRSKPLLFLFVNQLSESDRTRCSGSVSPPGPFGSHRPTLAETSAAERSEL